MVVQTMQSRIVCVDVRYKNSWLIVIMLKTLLHRIFKPGTVPKSLRHTLEQEGIVLLEEGIRGWFVTNKVSGPGMRYRFRKEGFIGFLGITKVRLICYTFGKRQINISLNDPKLAHLYIALPAEHTLSVAFESAEFSPKMKGVIEFRFMTEKAAHYHTSLLKAGARQGLPPE